MVPCLRFFGRRGSNHGITLSYRSRLWGGHFETRPLKRQGPYLASILNFVLFCLLSLSFLFLVASFLISSFIFHLSSFIFHRSSFIFHLSSFIFFLLSSFCEERAMAKKVTVSRDKSDSGRRGRLVGSVRDSTRQLRASFCVSGGPGCLGPKRPTAGVSPIFGPADKSAPEIDRY